MVVKKVKKKMNPIKGFSIHKSSKVLKKSNNQVTISWNNKGITQLIGYTLPFLPRKPMFTQNAFQHKYGHHHKQKDIKEKS